MANYTYNSSHTTNKDKVRAKLPDTGPHSIPAGSSESRQWLLSDETIELCLSDNSQDMLLTLADCAEIIAGHLADSGNYSINAGSSVSVSVNPATIWLKKAERWRKKAEENKPYFRQDAFALSIDKYGNDDSDYIDD